MRSDKAKGLSAAYVGMSLTSTHPPSAPPMTNAAPLEHHLLDATIATGDDLDPRRFRIEEGMSELFRLQLEVLSPNPDIDFAEVVGQPAAFRFMRTDGLPFRTWLGVVEDMRQVEVETTTSSLSTYRLTLVPRLWLLTQRRNHRIFQQKSEPEIVLALLEEWDIDVDPRVDMGDYPTRDYRVQYGESDFAFLSRMLEDAGITYFFELQGDRMVLVLSDSPAGAEPRPPLPYVHTPMTTGEPLVTAVHVGRRVRPGRYVQRDIDHRRPADFPVIAEQARGLDPEMRLERFHYVPGAFLFETSGGGDTPVGDDRGVHRANLDRGSEQVQRRLDAKRSSGRTVSFRAHASDLRPGEVLGFTGHPRSDLSPDRTMLLVKATHEGASNGDWVHRYEARFTDLPFRPPVRTPKPTVGGIESATVVGPAGEEIHVDELGRVRVHFHWDRESRMDQHSSCWVPVSHAWAGTGYGAVNIPRIGQEVIVDFLGGDPDRPIVVGRVYTSVQKVPYKLPVHKTQSGLKSMSSPATGGYNELMFEDAAGSENVRFQAEKDWNGLVKNNAVTRIGNDNTSSVGHDDKHFVGNDQLHRIEKNQTNLIGETRLVVTGKDHFRLVKDNLLQRTETGVSIHKSEKLMLLQSQERIVLKCGSSSIVLRPNEIVIQGDMTHINPGVGEDQCPAPASNAVLFGNP